MLISWIGRRHFPVCIANKNILPYHENHHLNFVYIIGDFSVKINTKLSVNF